MTNKTFYLVAATMVLVACGKEATVQEQEKVEIVKTMTLQPRRVQRQLSISTNLQGYETVQVAPSVQGRIEHIYVEVGDEINRGDSLVRMDQTQYRTAQLTMANLETEMTRMNALIETGSVSQQAYDQAKLGYDQTKENLAFLKKNTYYRAPFKGVVAAKNNEDGELYGGAPILSITQVDRLKALIAIPESYIPLIKEGKKLTLESAIYPNEVFPAFIEIVYPTVDAATHTFQCKVQIPNGKRLLRPGMYVTTTVPLNEEDVICVPYQSVEKLVGANDRYVFLNNNGVAQRVAVELGQRIGEDVEIIAPEIVPGAEYVYVGQHRLVDGVKLQTTDSINENAN
ncbi:MAG: efflux RND transporter periplasmic adaptor subunit [Bacteroidales bacterium]|nr:efflux RND transporter periplasmic adaptor subunit [Candidatus Colicola equi]